MKMLIDRKELMSIISQYAGKFKIEDDNCSLFSNEIGLTSVDMSYILLEIHKRYHVDLNWLVPQLDHYSLSELIDKLNLFGAASDI